MTDEPPMAVSNTWDGSDSTEDQMCHLPMSKMIGLCEKLKTQEHRLKGLDNLNALLREKDETISDLRDRLENCKSALSRTESQLSVLMRTGSNQTMSIGGRLVHQSGGNRDATRNLSLCQSSSAHQQQQRGHNQTESQSESIVINKSTDLEADCEGQNYHVRKNYHVSSTKLPVIGKDQILGSADKINSSNNSSSSLTLVPEADRVAPVIVNSVKSSDREMLPVQQSKRDSCQSVTSQINSGPQSFPSMNEVSHDLVGKLMSQNGRLKKVMRDILQQKGTTLSEYLEKQEYEDVIQQLRMEIKFLQSSVERLKSILSNQGESAEEKLKKVCTSQSEQISKLEKTLVVKQTMLTSYVQAYEKLKKECEELKTVVHPADDMRNKDSEQSVELEMLRKHSGQLLSELESTRSQLEQLKTSSGKKLVSDEDKDEVDRQELLRRNNELEQLNMVQKSQIVIFREDFVIAQKDNECQNRKLLDKIENQQNKIENQQKMLERVMQESQKYRLQIESMEKREQKENQFPWSSLDQSYRHREDLRIDGEPESLAHEHHSLKCPRCERPFDRAERAQWESHVTKCTDD